MKKFWVIAILLSVVLLGFSSLRAEESKEDKVSTLVILKNDFYFPSQGERFELQKLQVYWHKDWLGGGFDVDLIRQSDLLRVKPYVTVNKGPWYLLGGMSYTNANGNITEHAQLGFWYINKFGDWSVIADMRNYFGLDQKSLSYADNFFEVTHPIGKKFFAGIDVVYDHWWDGPSHNWVLAGPLVGYKLTENISPFVRVAHEWDFCAGKTKEANSIRLGVMIKF